jgi:hypothetical protein
MTRLWQTFAAILTALTVGAIASPAALAQGSGENSVTGSGATANGFFTNIVVDAHSDPSGANVSGSVSFTVLNSFNVGGPVTCLGIDGNRAVIGFNDVMFGFGPITVEVVDNGPTGTPPDTFFADPGTTDCLSNPTLSDGGPLGSGDLVITQVPPLTSKEQCMKGGWRDFTDDNGQPFKNQGACVKFVNHL